MSGTGRGDALVLCRITFAHRQRLLPVFPIFILQENRNRRADGLTATHSGNYACSIALYLHASAATITLLTSPEIAVEKVLVDDQARRHAREHRNQELSVRFPGGREAQHVQDFI